MRTRSDYPIAAMADTDAVIFTDLLLHDMGPSLKDDVGEESATGREWRTAPLISLATLGVYLHDGRADTIEEAIALHGDPEGEAYDSYARYAALSDTERALLLQYVRGL